MTFLAKSVMSKSIKLTLKVYKKCKLATLRSYWIPKLWFETVFIEIYNFAMTLCQHIVFCGTFHIFLEIFAYCIWERPLLHGDAFFRSQRDINRHCSWLDFWKIQVNLVNFLFCNFGGDWGKYSKNGLTFGCLTIFMFEIFS